MKWINVKDQLPTESGEYIVYVPYNEHLEPWVTTDMFFLPNEELAKEYKSDSFLTAKWALSKRFFVSHWMPLPRPPKE